MIFQQSKAGAFLSESGSESFDKFLNLMGDSITLQGWAGYRGGLDTKSKTIHLCRLALHFHKFKSKVLFVIFCFCHIFYLQMTLQELNPSIQCIRAMSSCSMCPPCYPTLKRTNSRWVLRCFVVLLCSVGFERGGIVSTVA